MFQTTPSRVEGEFLTGKVKLWETTKGYGFVSKVSDGGDDIFVHYTNVIVDSGRFPAISPETSVRLSFHLRQGRDTGIKVTDPNGNPLPGFFDKAEAIRQISGEPIQPSAERKCGAVKWFNNDKGFGFIQPDVAGVGGEDLFVHMKEVEGGLTSLMEGERVEYNVGIVNGRYRAVHVTCERAKDAQSTQVAQAFASPYAGQTSVVYNPETGAYQYANMGAGAAQYGAAGGMMYMDPSTYGLSQASQYASYMSQIGAQLQPGQTFMSGGQLYMMPPAQPTDATQAVQAKPGETTYQYAQSPLTQQLSQNPLSQQQQYLQQTAQLSQLQQTQGLFQQQPLQPQQKNPLSDLQAPAPPPPASQYSLQSQFPQQDMQSQLGLPPLSTLPSQPASVPPEQPKYDQRQSGLNKRAAPDDGNVGARKMIRQ